MTYHQVECAGCGIFLNRSHPAPKGTRFKCFDCKKKSQQVYSNKRNLIQKVIQNSTIEKDQKVV